MFYEIDDNSMEVNEVNTDFIKLIGKGGKFYRFKDEGDCRDVNGKEIFTQSVYSIKINVDMISSIKVMKLLKIGVGINKIYVPYKNINDFYRETLKDNGYEADEFSDNDEANENNVKKMNDKCFIFWISVPESCEISRNRDTSEIISGDEVAKIAKELITANYICHLYGNKREKIRKGIIVKYKIRDGELWTLEDGERAVKERAEYYKMMSDENDEGEYEDTEE